MLVDLFLISIDNILALVYNKSATIKEREEPMKKILTTLLLTLLILGMTLAFISCDKTPDTPSAESDSDSLPDDSESSTDQVTDEVIDLAEHKIIENGVVNYSVVRAESASSELVAGITALYDFLAHIFIEANDQVYKCKHVENCEDVCYFLHEKIVKAKNEFQ